jgi:hypothetical protein
VVAFITPTTSPPPYEGRAFTRGSRVSQERWSRERHLSNKRVVPQEYLGCGRRLPPPSVECAPSLLAQRSISRRATASSSSSLGKMIWGIAGSRSRRCTAGSLRVE